MQGDNDTALEKGLADKHDSVVENLTIRFFTSSSRGGGWVGGVTYYDACCLL